MQPVVCTDSKLTAHIAEGFGALVFPQTQDQFENSNAIVKVIEDLGVKKFAQLQPTSPLRKKSMLKQMLDMIPEKCASCYTAERVKLLGHLNGKFTKNVFDTGGSTAFQHCDGNIFCCTSDYFLSHDNYFIGEDSVAVPNEQPYSLQIDTEQDFDMLDDLAVAQPHLLCHGIKNIAFVQNQRILRRDYSTFIDGCDLVVRTGKLDNIETGRVGKRTDFSFQIPITQYTWAGQHEEDKHLDHVNKAAMAFIMPLSEPAKKIFPYGINYSRTFERNKEVKRKGQWTTTAVALQHTLYTFPDAVVYNMGTFNIYQHCDHGTAVTPWHAGTDEGEFLCQKEQEGRIVNILEEDCELEQGRFSTLPKTDTDIPIMLSIRGQGITANWWYSPSKGRISSNGSMLKQYWGAVKEFIPRRLLTVNWNLGKDGCTISYTYDRKSGEYVESSSPITPRIYTHAFMIGEECTSYYLISIIYGTLQYKYGPIDLSRVPSLRAVMGWILNEGKDMWNREDMVLTPGLDDKVRVLNLKTRQSSEHWISTSASPEDFDEKFDNIKWKNERRWNYFLDTLRDPKNKVLLVYIGYGTEYFDKFGKESFRMDDHAWYSLEDAQEFVKVLNNAYQADISLFYLNKKKDETPQQNKILYIDDHLIAGTHNADLAHQTDARARSIYDNFYSTVSTFIIPDSRDGDSARHIVFDTIIPMGQDRTSYELACLLSKGTKVLDNHYVNGLTSNFYDTALALCNYNNDALSDDSIELVTLRKKKFYCLYDKKQGISYENVFGTNISTYNDLDDKLPYMQARVRASYDCIVKQLEEKESTVLLLWFGFGKAPQDAIECVLPHEKAIGFNIERTKEGLKALRERFAVDIKLLYVDYEAGSRPRIVYQDDNMLLCTSPYSGEWRVGKSVKYMANLFKNEFGIILDRFSIKTDDHLALPGDMLTVEVSHPKWRDRVHLNLYKKTGNRQNATNQTFKINEFVEDKKLQIHWDGWNKSEQFIYDIEEKLWKFSAKNS